MDIYITFPTTTSAMRFEQLARERNLRGRIVPAPRVLSASCGMAWAAPEEEEVKIREAICENAVQFGKIATLKNQMRRAR